MAYSAAKPPAGIPPSTYDYLHALSPMARADAVKVPTILLIGEGDRRVPPDQGRAWYHALKRNRAPVEMYTFPGNGHALDSCQSPPPFEFQSRES